jgi:hypothetical protein
MNRDCPFNVSVTVRMVILFQDNEPAEESMLEGGHELGVFTGLGHPQKHFCT